jgi:hypothetical protein
LWRKNQFPVLTTSHRVVHVLSSNNRSATIPISPSLASMVYPLIADAFHDIVSFPSLSVTRAQTGNTMSLASAGIIDVLMDAGFPAISSSSKNGLMMSIGNGKTTVEFCSAPISVRVCR